MVREKKNSCPYYVSIFFILLVLSIPKKCSAFLDIDVDKFMFNCSLSALKMSAKCAFYTVLHSPRMMLLVASLYFHKEIARLLKDYLMYLAGEYPAIFFAASSAGLFYIMYGCNLGKT